MDNKAQNDQPADSAQTERFLRHFLSHQNRIYATILMLIPNNADAEDLFQETATVLWRKFGEFTEGTNFAAWAASIARYRVLNYRKKQIGKKWKLST